MAVVQLPASPSLPLGRSSPVARRSPAPSGTPSRWGEGLPPDLVYPWDSPDKHKGRGPRRRGRAGRIVLAGLGLLALVVVARLLVFCAAISTAPLYSAHFWPFGGEANVLVMGYGGRAHEGRYLTDSLLLLHADLGTRQTAQIGVPRDLWVQIPPDSGRYAKLNSAYEYGFSAGGGPGEDPAAGGRMATTKVSQVTGLPVDRWVTIDFQGFRALVDALGGVEIEVERGFTSRYPASDDPAINPDWITVTFEAGRQHMDGETAIRYARARYAETPEEASDFARAQRQQRLLAAIAAKLKSPASWWRLPAVLNALQPVLRTNLAPFDLLTLFLRADLGNATRINLNDGNLLEDAVSEDGQEILRPRGNDFRPIERYIRDRLGE